MLEDLAIKDAGERDWTHENEEFWIFETFYLRKRKRIQEVYSSEIFNLCIWLYIYIYTRGSDDKMVLLLAVVMANLYILTHYNKIVL